jgi:hypothetical protein
MVMNFVKVRRVSRMDRNSRSRRISSSNRNFARSKTASEMMIRPTESSIAIVTGSRAKARRATS